MKQPGTGLQGSKLLDVARLAGVSPGTASRVLSGSPYPVSAQTRLQVQEAAAKLGYVPNSIARALVTGHTTLVSAIVHDITDPFFNEVVRGLQDASAGSGVSVLVGNDDRESSKLERYLTMMLGYNVTGVVLVGGEIRDPATASEVASAIRMLRTRGIPLVSVGRNSLDIPSVNIDNTAMAETAVSHLAELGHTSIAFIGGDLRSTTVEDRYSGYVTALSRAGIPLDPQLVIETSLTREGGAEGVTRLLRSGARFTGVLAVNDEVAISVIAALRGANRIVPDEVSVVGINDVPVATYVDPPLTTVHVPLRELGCAAWELLLSQRKPGKSEVRREVRTDLVIRRSSGPAPSLEKESRVR